MNFKLKKITSTTTFKQSTVTGVSTVINGGLGALFYFLLAKFLGRADYGIFTLAATIVAMLSGIVDLGSDQALVRFVPKYKQEPDLQKKIIKLLLNIKLISTFIALAFIILLARPISGSVLGQPDFYKFLPLVGIGILTQILFSFSTSLSQSLEKFFIWSGLFIGTNLFRLILVLVLFYLGGLTSHSSIIIYILIPILGFIFSFFFLNADFLKAKGEWGYLKQVFSFNKGVVAFIIVATIGARLEIFFTARYLGFAYLGVYGLILQISSVLPQLTAAIGAVTSPKFSSFTTVNQNKAYTLKASLLTTFVAFVSTLVLAPLGWIILQFSGPGYLEGFIPFLVLLLAMVVFLINSPIRDSIIYFFGKPIFFFYNGMGHAILVSILSIILIPRFNILGTALVVLLGQIFIALSSIWYYTYKTKTV